MVSVKMLQKYVDFMHRNGVVTLTIDGVSMGSDAPPFPTQFPVQGIVDDRPKKKGKKK